MGETGAPAGGTPAAGQAALTPGDETAEARGGVAAYERHAKHAARPAADRVWPWLALAAACMVVLAHPLAPPWYDEIFSLSQFVAGGPAHILTDYHLPNNHMLFSLALWAWSRVGGASIPLARLYVLALSMLALPGLYMAGKALRGPRAGALAALAFAVSHVVGNYSTQLRGYGLGMALVALALGCGTCWWRAGFHGRGTATGFVAGGALAIGVLPTNALFVAVLSAWLFLAGRVWRRPDRRRVLAVLAAPALGLLTYAAVLPELAHFASILRVQTAAQFYHELLVDLLVWDQPWLVPLIAAGLYAGRRDARVRACGVLAALCAASTLLPLVSNVPWARNYLALLPLLALVAGVSLDVLAVRMDAGPYPATRVSPLFGFALMLCVLAGTRELVLAAAPAVGGVLRRGSLVDPYYLRDSYAPARTDAVLAAVPAHTILLIRHTGYLELLSTMQRLNRRIQVCRVFYGALVCDAPPQGKPAAVRRIVTVAPDEATARYLLDTLEHHVPEVPRNLRLLPVHTGPDHFRLWVAPLHRRGR